MERELWPPLYHALCAVANNFHQKYVSYQPWVLVAVFCWAALHGRSVAWACQARHWSTTKLRPWQLPHRSTLSRRLNDLANAVCKFHAASASSCMGRLPARKLIRARAVWLRTLRITRWHRCPKSFAQVRLIP
jgi:hypothetical protein